MSWYRAKYETPKLRWTHRADRREAHCGSAPLCRLGKARARIVSHWWAWAPGRGFGWCNAQPHRCSP